MRLWVRMCVPDVPLELLFVVLDGGCNVKSVVVTFQSGPGGWESRALHSGLGRGLTGRAQIQSTACKRVFLDGVTARVTRLAIAGE